MTYLHLPALGNPRENRSGFAEKGTQVGREARERYCDDVLSTDLARAALTEIRLLAETTHVIVLCVEADENSCHRQLVIEAARALHPAAIG